MAKVNSMILELDCGNSLIKWRVLDTNNIVLDRGASQHLQQLLIDINNAQQPIHFCRIVSVRSTQETTALITELETHYAITVQQILSSPTALGVKNGYQDHTRLGADRWAAIVAAYHKNRQATLTLSFGTAITSDFIDKNGQHLGGFIAPGLPLMRQQLLANTGRIHYHENLAKDILAPIIKPGTSTESAVNGGCHLMLQGFISQQLQLAHDYFGEHFFILVAGGDAKYLDIPNAQYVPDLVFNGLALLCPFNKET